MSKALEGVRVIDLSNHLAGPFCAMQLGDLGAEVIKIEPPTGDLSRTRATDQTKGQAPYYLSANRNKQGMVLNLKNPEALETLYKLVKISDVLIENYRPGVSQKLGVDYDTVKRVNPKIIYASITGFGLTGPYSPRPSFDGIAQAMGGMMSLTGGGGTPIRTAGSIGDTIPGLYTAIAVLGALYHARNTGEGQHIDISQAHSITASMPIPVQTYLVTRTEEEPGPRFPLKTLSGVYPTSDGYVAIAALYQFMDTLVEIVGADDPSVSAEWRNTKSLSRDGHGRILDWLKTKTNKEVEAVFLGKIPYGPVMKLSEILSDPQAVHRQVFVDVEHPLGFTYKTTSSPMRLSVTPATIERAPPSLGQDTATILSLLLGLSDEEITRIMKASDP